MIFLKKILILIKVYWYIPLLIIIFPMIYFFTKEDLNISLLLRNREKIFKKELFIIESNNSLILKDFQDNQDNYFKEKDKLDSSMKIKSKELLKNRDEQIQDIVNNKDLEEISVDIGKKYNW